MLLLESSDSSDCVLMISKQSEVGSQSGRGCPRPQKLSLGCAFLLFGGDTDLEVRIDKCNRECFR